MTNEIVRLNGVSFPPEYQSFLQTCEKLGFKNSVLVGGALRDSRLGTPVNDWDVLADYNGSPIARDTPQAAAEKARTILSHTEGVTGIRVDDKFVVHPQRKGFRIFFNYNGHPVDLFATNAPRGLSAQLNESDAPINCIGMNAKGEVFCHSQFVEHAEKRVYSPLPDVPAELAGKRFDHLRQKIPGLTMLAGAQELTVSVNPQEPVNQAISAATPSRSNKSLHRGHRRAALKK